MSQMVAFLVLLTISVCFFTPLAVIAWLMVKRKAKRIVFMLVFGVTSRAIGLIIQVPLLLMLGQIDGFTELPFWIYSTITGLVSAVVGVVGICIVLFLIKKNGLNYNRAATIGTGFAAVDIIVGTGMSYLAKLMLIPQIKDGSIYDNYSKDQSMTLIDSITATSCIADALCVVVTMAVAILILLLLVYGMANGKFSNMVSISFAIECAYMILKSVVAHYFGIIVGIVVLVIMLIISVAGLVIMTRRQENMVIKPESMLHNV